MILDLGDQVTLDWQAMRHSPEDLARILVKNYRESTVSDEAAEAVVLYAVRRVRGFYGLKRAHRFAEDLHDSLTKSGLLLNPLDLLAAATAPASDL